MIRRPPRSPLFPSPTLSRSLAGHTHGGQIRLPFYTPYVPYGSGRFVAGWYKDTVAPLYVARGVGTVGIHARLFCPPELPVLDRKSTRLNSSHLVISYAVFCL